MKSKSMFFSFIILIILIVSICFAQDDISAKLTPSAINARIAELGNRCFIARNDLPDCETVIGIGTNVDPAPKGFATDLYLFSVPTWTDEHRNHAKKMKQELGYFREPKVTCEGVDEFPKRNQQ